MNKKINVLFAPSDTKAPVVPVAPSIKNPLITIKAAACLSISALFARSVFSLLSTSCKIVLSTFKILISKLISGLLKGPSNKRYKLVGILRLATLFLASSPVIKFCINS